MHYSELKTLPAVRLRAYARDVLAVRVDDDENWKAKTENRPWMLEQICQLHANNGDPVQGVPGNEAKAVEVGRHRKGEARIKLLIHPDEDMPEFVFLGNNGDNVMVQRDQEVLLPMRFFECLRDARMDVSDFDYEGEVRRVRAVPRYHYTVLEAPQEAAAAG